MNSNSTTTSSYNNREVTDKTAIRVIEEPLEETIITHDNEHI